MPQHAESRVADLITSHRPGLSLAQPFYADAAVFRAEIEAIWHRQWIFAGMACEVSKPGMWFRYDIAHASVIVTRDQNSELRAFHNTCRHRGSRICSAERGNSRTFTCPYHQWTYAATGDLMRARDMGDDFDKSNYSLTPVHIREVAGYVFISLAEQAPSFDAFVQGVTPYLARHQLGQAKVAHESTLIERANWKLVIENNRECYHCRVSHPELLRTIAEVEDTSDPRCPPGYREKLMADESRWDEQGLPYSLIADPEGWQIVRVPMVNGKSFTMTGEPASRRVMGELPDFDVGSVRLLHFPNTWNHALGDHAIAFRVTPIDEQTTAVTTKWLVHADAVEGVDYDLDTLTHVWNATNNQDRKLAENNQLGINTPGYRPGPYSPESEGGVMAFIEWYMKEMRAAHVAANPQQDEALAI